MKVENPILSDAISQHFFLLISLLFFSTENLFLSLADMKEKKVRHLFCISIFLFSPLLLHRCQGREMGREGIQQFNLPENIVSFYVRDESEHGQF